MAKSKMWAHKNYSGPLTIAALLVMLPGSALARTQQVPVLSIGLQGECQRALQGGSQVRIQKLARQILLQVALGQLLSETDSPFITPAMQEAHSNLRMPDPQHEARFRRLMRERLRQLIGDQLTDIEALSRVSIKAPEGGDVEIVLYSALMIPHAISSQTLPVRENLKSHYPQLFSENEGLDQQTLETIISMAETRFARPMGWTQIETQQWISDLMKVYKCHCSSSCHL